MKIQDLLTSESTWTQGVNARDIDGNEVDEYNSNAVCWCLSAAIEICYFGSDKFYEFREQIAKDLKVEFIHLWNDEEKRTFKDVRNLIEELDI